MRTSKKSILKKKAKPKPHNCPRTISSLHDKDRRNKAEGNKVLFFTREEASELINKTFDNVNKPKHYTDTKIEVIDYIEDKGLCFHLGNAVKYISRAKKKGNELEDLKKAVWYINRKIENLENENK